MTVPLMADQTAGQMGVSKAVMMVHLMAGLRADQTAVPTAD